MRQNFRCPQQGNARATNIYYIPFAREFDNGSQHLTPAKLQLIFLNTPKSRVSRIINMEISYRSGKIESFRIENYKGERNLTFLFFYETRRKRNVAMRENFENDIWTLRVKLPMDLGYLVVTQIYRFASSRS